MGSFDSVLGAEQTIFSNPDALDPDFVPKLLPHREEQQKYIATCIKPLFLERSGKNLIIKGTSGIGKTASVRRVLYDLEEETENIKYTYVNCWTKNTTYKALTGVCHDLGYKFTHNMSTDEIVDKLGELTKQYKGYVFVFDEIDKADDYDFLYFLLELPIKKVILLITSDYGWGADLDPRIISRLVPDTISFKPYSFQETANILQERLKYAFYQDVWSKEAFAKIAERAAKFEDVRVGILLLKAAGSAAEADSSKKVLEKHADEAIKQTDEIKIRTSSEITDEEKQILELCRENSGALFGDLYSAYQSKGGDKTDRTFRNKLSKLASRDLIEMELLEEGVGGKSTRITYKGFEKTLDEFS